MDVERVNKLFQMKGPNLTVHGSIVKGKTGYETIVLGTMVNYQAKSINEIIRIDVKCKQGSGIRVGITTLENANIVDYPVGMHKFQYSMRFKDGYKFNDAIGEPYGIAVGPNDVIRMQLTNDELSFEIGGQSCGCAYKVIPNTYYPAISLFNFAEIDVNLA